MKTFNAWGWYWLLMVAAMLVLFYRYVVIPWLDRREYKRRWREAIAANQEMHRRAKPLDDDAWARARERADAYNQQWNADHEDRSIR